MLALADRAEMPSLAMRLGNLLVSSSDELHDSTAYPAPALHAGENQAIDRELILAIVRQESGFNPKAKESPGRARANAVNAGYRQFCRQRQKVQEFQTEGAV